MPTELMNPRGIVPHVDTPLAPRRGFEDGMVVGLFSNQKANADRFLENIASLLSADYPGVEFVWQKKMASLPAKFSPPAAHCAHSG